MRGIAHFAIACIVMSPIFYLSGCSERDACDKQNISINSIEVKCLDQKWIFSKHDGALYTLSGGNFYLISTDTPVLSGPTQPPKGTRDLVDQVSFILERRYKTGFAKHLSVTAARDKLDPRWENFPAFTVKVELKIDGVESVFLYRSDFYLECKHSVRFDDPESKIFSEVFFRLYSFQFINE